MNLRQLEYFVAVAEEGGFTRAAERVHISQSGVSAQIGQLERELGSPLIERGSRPGTLTPAGEAAIAPARAVLKSEAAVRSAVDDVVGIVRGDLRVAMVTACTVTPLFDALAQFRARHPDVSVSLTEDDSVRMLERVRMGDVDTALVGCADGPPTDLDSLPIITEGLVVAVPPDHPLTQYGEVDFAALAEYPLVCLQKGTGIRTVLEYASEAHGIRPTVTLQATAPAAVKDLAQRGLGVAILSASMLPDAAGGLVPVPLTGIGVSATLSMVWRHGTSNPALGAFLHLCASAFGVDTAACCLSPGFAGREYRSHD